MRIILAPFKKLSSFGAMHPNAVNMDELTVLCIDTQLQIPEFDLESDFSKQRDTPCRIFYQVGTCNKILPEKFSAASEDANQPTLNLKICDRLFLLADNNVDKFCVSKTQTGTVYLPVDSLLSYDAFCDDFGPLSLDTTVQFFHAIEEALTQKLNHSIVLKCSLECRPLTNLIFLAGSYLMMKFDADPDEIVKRLAQASDFVVSFRDVLPGPQNFHLYLRDCWAGLWRAKELGWVQAGFHDFDAAERAHYGSPLNADLHEIVPGKFVAMRGPVDIPRGEQFRDTAQPDGSCRRDFSPAHCLDALHHFGVQAVVRLSAPEYDKGTFVEAGLGFADLPFEDCACPPAGVVAKFMMIAEGLPGVLAVHGRSGLGRAGTLIALYMMQHLGFTARSAMGWLRLVRPGSIIGPQQDYLVKREAVMCRTASIYRRQGPNLVLAGAGPAEIARLIADAASIVDSRLRAFRAPRLRVRDDSVLPVFCPPSAPAGSGGGSGSQRPNVTGGGEVKRCSSCGEARQEEPEDVALRFCADLLQLPTA